MRAGEASPTREETQLSGCPIHATPAEHHDAKLDFGADMSNADFRHPDLWKLRTEL
jgi:hypothetical protein